MYLLQTVVGRLGKLVFTQGYLVWARMNNEFKEGSIRQKLSGQATSFQFLCRTAEPGMSASGTKQTCGHKWSALSEERATKIERKEDRKSRFFFQASHLVQLAFI